jgi:hypothetical protein
VRADWLRDPALVASGIASGLLLAELVLRAAGVAYPVFSRPDDERGWALRPGARGAYMTEGNSFIEINRDGLRDREHSRTKPAETLRIAVLGDSYTEALAIPIDQTFWRVLERELNRDTTRHSSRVEVLNFGVNGYSTAQELLTLGCCVWAYTPDIVLLAFYPGNDLHDNSPALDWSPTRYARPYFTRTPAGWSVDRSFKRSWRYRAGKVAGPLLTHSRVLQVANRAYNTIVRQRRTGVAMDAEFRTDLGVYLEPATQDWIEAWRSTEAMLTAMAREVSSHGARFAVVTVTAPIQVYPDPAVRARVTRQFAGLDLLRPGRRIQALGESEGFPVLELAPQLQAYADAHRAFLHGFGNTTPGIGHWNSLGHRVAGVAIATWMAGWLDDQPRAASK